VPLVAADRSTERGLTMASAGVMREESNGNGADVDRVRAVLDNKDFYVPVAVALAGGLVAVTAPWVVRGLSGAMESVKELEFEPSEITEKVSSSLGLGEGSGQSGSGSSGRKSGGQKRRSSSASRSSGTRSGGQTKRSSVGGSSAKRSRSSSGGRSKPKS
jgi:hypothetical protein